MRYAQKYACYNNIITSYNIYNVVYLIITYR